MSQHLSRILTIQAGIRPNCGSNSLIAKLALCPLGSMTKSPFTSNRPKQSPKLGNFPNSDGFLGGFTIESHKINRWFPIHLADFFRSVTGTIYRCWFSAGLLQPCSTPCLHSPGQSQRMILAVSKTYGCLWLVMETDRENSGA